MLTQSKGKIYLADERGLNQADWFRSINIFNFGSYQHRHKQAFGDLYVLNEDTLAGGRSLHWLIKESTHVVLLPIVGAIVYNYCNGLTGTVEAGMVQVLSFSAGERFEITNLYPDELVQYLQLWIKVPEAQVTRCYQNKFDIDNYQLVDLFEPKTPEGCQHYAGAIMKLNGRQEETYQLKNPGNGIFVYVLQGALEVQYRLVHQGDGLGLWDIDEVEFEALSNDAILLIIEVPV